jgi:L-seryl-tRNA(Ser) seleniumtransferase
LGGAYDPYEKYGLKRVINAATSLTLLGGSMPHPEVFKAMEDASKAFVSIPILQHWAGKRIAEAFGAEAGLPTAGAVNALILAVASCMMKGTELEDHNPLGPPGWSHLIQRLPIRTEGLKTEFIVQGVNRNVYDHAVECAGARLVEAGSRESITQRDLSNAFNEESTAGYYYTVTTSKGKLPIKDVAEVAHDHGVPLIVDAAPSLTHKAIPRGILEAGADLVIFSGGKQMGGPNNSGLLIGRKDLVKLAHLQSYPFDGIGRASKMSREAIAGLVKALELFMERDDNAYYSGLEEKTKELSIRLDEIPEITSGVLQEPTVVGGLIGPSYAYIELHGDAGISLKGLHTALLDGDPSIRTLHEPYFVTPEAKDRITIKAEYLLEGDDDIILTRIAEIIENPPKPE